MGWKHTLVKNHVLVACSIPGVTLYSLETGSATADSGRRVKFGIEGGADIIGCFAPHGRFFGLEIKVGSDRVSDAQKRFRRVLITHGAAHAYLRARNTDPAELDRIVQASKKIVAGWLRHRR
jgi:hypothetical protein